MKLTMLGSSASYAGAGQACSGMLVESGDVRVVIDLGNGTLANLASVTDPAGVAGVFISHAHPDHFLDLYALQALLRFAPDGPASPLRLFAPPGLLERMGTLLSERGRQDLYSAFDALPLAPGVPVELGCVAVTPHPVDHIEDAMAFVVEADGARLCYTSDTAFGDAALAAAAGADVVVAECTLPEAYRSKMPHMTAAEAGELARLSGARTLVLTHMWPTVSRDELRREAAEVFPGEVVTAAELLTMTIEPGAVPGREGRQS